MDLEEKKFRDAEQLLHQSGYTLTELMKASSRYNSSLLMVSDEDNENAKFYILMFIEIVEQALMKLIY